MGSRNQVWTTKDGRKVKVRDMTDSHLTNTLRFLARKAQLQASKDTVFLLNTPPPQGEYAQMAFDEECDARLDITFEDYVPDIYWDMHDEYARRGLDLEALSDYNEGIEQAGAALEINALCEHLESRGK